MTALATSIPGSSNNGYVAAAYIVFFAIVLIYVAIMALRLTRVERSLRELNERGQAPGPDGTGPATATAPNASEHEGDPSEGDPRQTREREAV
jgi:hypothetical protein